MKGKMAIIGDGDSVLAFKSVGIDAFSENNIEKIRNLLKKLAKDYKIIFITDTLAKQVDDILTEYLTMPYPIIVSVPSKAGSNGYGMSVIRNAMEKALGVDILFKDNEE